MGDTGFISDILAFDRQQMRLLVEDRLMIVTMALLANVLFFSRERLDLIPRLLQPIALLDRFLLYYEQRLNRSNRSVSKRKARGTMILICAALFGAAMGILLAKIPPFIDRIIQEEQSYGWITTVIVLAFAMGWRSMYDTANWLCDRSHDASLQEMRHYLADISYINTTKTDEFGIYRHSCELLVQRMSVHVIGSALWFILLGLPGLGAYLAICRSHIILGQQTEQMRAFGSAARSVAILMHGIPAIISAFIFSLSTLFTSASRIGPAWNSWRLTTAEGKAVPIHTLPLFVVANATGSQFGGRRLIHHILTSDEWVGSGTARTNDTQLRLLTRMTRVALLCVILIFGVLTILVA